jgi:hypothetical protein
MRDRRNAVIWAIGMWFLRRTMRKRAAGGSGSGRWGRRLFGLVKLAAVVGIAYVAWRKFAGAPKTPTL